MTKEERIYNGEKKISLTSGAGKCRATYMWMIFQYIHTTVLYNQWCFESISAELHIQNYRYAALTVKLNMDFWLHGGSAPPKPSIVKGSAL